MSNTGNDVISRVRLIKDSVSDWLRIPCRIDSGYRIGLVKDTVSARFRILLKKRCRKDIDPMRADVQRVIDLIPFRYFSGIMYRKRIVSEINRSIPFFNACVYWVLPLWPYRHKIE